MVKRRGREVTIDDEATREKEKRDTGQKEYR